MKKKIKRTLTPKLRFPEFTEEWRPATIGEVFNSDDKPVKATRFERDKILTVKLHANGVVRNERTGALTGGANYFTRRAGQFIFSKIDLLNGAFGIVPKEFDGFCSSSDVPAFSFGTEQSPSFFLNWLTARYRRLDIERTGTSATLKRVSPAKFWEIPILLPTPAEQQKIVEFLSSLDGLIAAEGRALEALKTHKKGLMQQLFPRPGQTQPRLRFPEFLDKREWGKFPLGKLLSRKPEYGVNAAAVPFSEDLPTYIRITDIGDVGQFAQDNRVSVDIEAKDENYLVEGDIVLARTGASVGKSYRYSQKDGRLVFAGFLIRVRPNPKKLVPDFLSNYLTTWQYWDWVRVNSARSGQPGINGSEYASMPVPTPPAGPKGNELAEQQKIAACLIALYTQIAAQAAKIEALKTHKRGLMQQLFPAPEEQ